MVDPPSKVPWDAVAMSSIIETNGLVMQFPATRALDGLDLRVPSGVTGLVGANGAGKTTLISLVLGLLQPTSGTISVLGLDPRVDGPRLRAMIGYGPERNVLPDDMQAYDFVRHFAQIRGLPHDEARSRASDSLYLVGLGEERFRALGTMSTGQRQRVKLAQAIAADPSLIVLDEPTDGLDPVQRDEMLSIIVDVNRKFGIDVMLSSHVLEEVERICDHVVALDAGRLVAQGSMTELAGALGGVEVELIDLVDRPGSIDAVERQLVDGGLTVRRLDFSLSVSGSDRRRALRCGRRGCGLGPGAVSRSGVDADPSTTCSRPTSWRPASRGPDREPAATATTATGVAATNCVDSGSTGRPDRRPRVPALRRATSRCRPGDPQRRVAEHPLDPRPRPTGGATRSSPFSPSRSPTSRRSHSSVCR